MASVPVANSKQMVGSGRNNLSTRLNIPSNPLTPTSSAPSSLSPLVVPAPNSSNGSYATQQRVTSELINAISTSTSQPDLFDDECISSPNGEKIDPAKLKELCKLDEGAGTVIKVEDTSTGFLMAKKKIIVDPEPNVFKQILRELQFLRTCHSPNIVSYYGAILEDSNSSIAIFMEYCEGGSLDSIYKNVKQRGGRISEILLGKIGESVLKGLVYLYSQQIIHRDIKPSNILVTKKGEIKICDFGVSGKLVNSIAYSYVGSSYYCAPERILGLPYKVSADVWSLGLTIMEVAQNQLPYPKSLSSIELVTYITHSPAPTLSKEYEWSEEIEDFLKICLEKDGAKRPTPKQMLDHPFIHISSQRRINSGLWIKQVWNSVGIRQSADG